MKTIQILLVAFFATTQVQAQGIMLAGGAVQEAPEPGLLDDYPGAAAAYSLRSLSSTYTGPVVEVRRSSDNATQDFTADLVSTIPTWVGTGNDGFVQTWYDQSGNGNHAVQGTYARQPLLVSNGAFILLNGKPAIQFIRTNNWYLNIASITKSTSNTAFNVVYRTSPGTSNIYPFAYSLNFDRNFFDNATNLYVASNSGGSASFNGNIVYNTQRLETINYSSTGSFYKNGVYQGGFSVSPTADSGASWVGSAAVQTTQYAFNGLMQELIYYPSNQIPNRSDIDLNINNYYNIY